MNQYLTFKISDDTCAVRIRDVETVLENEKLGCMPGAPGYVAGLLSLRGDVVPVIDVRRKLGLEPAPPGVAGSIIVLSFGGEGRDRPVGALVDSVSEVIELPDEAIVPIDDFPIAFDRDVVRGIGRRSSGFVVLLAAERLFERPKLEGVA